MLKQNEIIELAELPDKFVVQFTDPKTGKVGYMGFKRIHKRAFKRHYIPTNWTSNSSKFVRFVQNSILSLAIFCGGALGTKQIMDMIDKPGNGVLTKESARLVEDSLGIKFFD
jgi:hypothetical protein